MLSDSESYLLIGGLAGAAVVIAAIGIARSRFRQSVTSTAAEPSSPLTPTDRHEIRGLLQQLISWANVCTATVAQDRSRLAGLISAVQQEAGASAPQSVSRVIALLDEIVQRNDQLQQRLEAAQMQLERQIHQIESYLTEARTDGLTQLANRRSFDVKIEQMLSAYRNGGQAFVLAMVDIDHFKTINDSYGHQVGDEVLQYVAAALTKAFEGAYLVARYGGEEFALLLPGPLPLAAQRADAVRKRLAQQRIEIAGQVLQITLSCGLSQPQDEPAAERVIRRADEALYEAKKLGRNRVCYHDGRQSVLLGSSEPVEPTS